MSSPSVLELSKQLMQLDNQAKALRNEVEYLRATKRSLEVSNTTEGKLSEMRDSTGSTAKSQRSRASARRSGTAGGTSISLPQDFIDDLAQKRSDVEASIRTHKKLLREKEALQTALAKAEDATEAAEQEYLGIVEVVGIDTDGNSNSAVGLKKKNAYGIALKNAVAVYQQRENVRIQMEGQSRELLRLAAILQETTDAESQRAEAVEVLAERKTKLEALRHECNTIARAAARREKIADRNQHGLTSEDYIRHSNFDRRVALHELSKEDNLIKQNNLAIRYRAMQIAKIQAHLELIGDAVTGDDMEEEERVDADIVEELAKEINDLYDSHLVANLRMDTIDCEIEKMVWRASALQHAKESTVVEMGRVRREHRRYLDELQKTVDKERVSNGQTIMQLQDELETLHRSSARKK
ncbi:protein of unknown function - conserved [Leishmania donovani]|uniref:Hypothetical_protein_conserved n=1 Tax=Leishmania donovani TaxID=5661 RepID=A0A3S7X0N0_LEIDO|nr:hypothetical protein, conserved [Leishmania donovani]AYU80005.1 hypothetical protein LdCL_270017500 [Leishmania donovani]TPP46070.1 hypothetical protein CGC20_32770 [Leishmania donovani]TPP47530.1 hypothetical protein CGC21_30860 [Leishmania donovani]CAJ1989989.1 protein of unknown function - conserved [Leishmania donovani]CBZ35270.1 hypothetical protein, conserved [Leishmania donovani]